MKRILVPTDFSENAYAALLYASRLYSKESVKITLLHSYEGEVSQMTSRVDVGKADSVLKRLHANSEKDGKILMDRINQDVNSNGHVYEMISTPTPLSKFINSLIKTEGVDLTVMGSKGRTGAAEVLLGSTTEEITESIEGCPLLIVPYEVNFVIPARIAFASDFNEFYRLSRFKPITRLVRHYHSEINIVHVGQESDLGAEQKKNMEKFRNDLSEYDVDFHFVAKKGSISNTLHEFIDSRNIDFFSLIFHKHAFLKKLFREPVVSRVGKHKNVPTLVIPVQLKK